MQCFLPPHKETQWIYKIRSCFFQIEWYFGFWDVICKAKMSWVTVGRKRINQIWFWRIPVQCRWILLSTKSYAVRKEFTNNTQNWLNKSSSQPKHSIFNHKSMILIKYRLQKHTFRSTRSKCLCPSLQICQNHSYSIWQMQAQIIMKTIHCYRSWRFRERAIY